jgi:predicted esterase
VPKVNARAVPWEALTREAGRADSKDHLRPQHSWVIDKAVIQQEIENLEKDPSVVPPGSADQGFKPMAWWTRLRRWEFDKRLTATEHAGYYARHTADVLRWFEKREPTSGELPLLFEHGLMLFYGHRDVEAEQILRRVLAVPAGPIRAALLDEYQANAAFRLAQLLRQAGRVPEAMEMATHGLELDRSGPHRLVTQRYNYLWNKNDLSACLLRLLREIRQNPAEAVLPVRVGVVSVPTPNGDNPVLHVFYRTPPDTQRAERRRVLVVAPVHNADALSVLSDDSEWARFADENGLVLVVPQFYVSDISFRIDNRFSHVRYAQVWSGDALLRALDEIHRRTPVEKNRLLLHGIASGGGFACHFAAWRPDLVAAVSVNNGNFWMPRFRSDGLQPMNAQKRIRYFMTASEADNFETGGFPRYDTAVDFVTRLRGAGVNVEWRSWPDAPHLPTLEMEEAARVFLKKQSSQ